MWTTQKGDKMNTRVFFVVDSSEDNEEIFETLEEANKFFRVIKNNPNASIYIAIVKNAFKEDTGEWNYDDRADTFEKIQVLQKGEETTYDLKKDHAGIKAQIREWETKIDNINRQLTTVFEELTLGDIPAIQEQLDDISHEIMSINL